MILEGSYLIYQAERATTRAERRANDIRTAELAQALCQVARRRARVSSPYRELNREGK